MSDRPQTAFKIVDRAEWEAAIAAGSYPGSVVDRTDGYIHMSTADQLAETARRHYAGQRDLLLLTVSLSALGPAVRWEASRGGDMFPHLYAPLAFNAVTASREMSVTADGAMVFADGRPV